MDIGSISIPPTPVVANLTPAINLLSAVSSQVPDNASAPSVSPETQILLDNYRANISTSDLSAPQIDASAERFSRFISVAEQTPGVTIQDGVSGNEYLLVANSISDNPALKDKFQSLDTTIGNVRPELFGQYGLQGRNLLDVAGNPKITVDEAAAEFNRLIKPETSVAEAAAETGAAEEAEAAGEAGSGSEADAAEEAGGSKGDAKEAVEEAGGGSSAADMMASLWPFILGLFDEDGDGKISPQEFMKGMAKLDKNTDGKITKDELIAAGATEDQATQLMASMDKSEDGSISIGGADSEVNTFVAAANENGDAEISETEMNTASETVKPKDAAA